MTHEELLAELQDAVTKAEAVCKEHGPGPFNSVQEHFLEYDQADLTAVEAELRGAKRMEEILGAENARLQRIIDREPEFGAMQKDASGVVVPIIDHPMTHIIVSHLAEMLTQSNAVNYVAISCDHVRLGRLECCVQRVGKLSPHEARKAAEKALQKAVTLLTAHDIPWEGPTEFLPDNPVPSSDKGAIDAHIVIDINVRPNTLLCTRCNRKVALPDPIEADMLKAMGEVFTKTHLNCEVL